jgi:hypothetical protein
VISMSNFEFLKDPNLKIILFIALIIGFVLMFSRMIHSSISGSGPVLIAKMALGCAIVIGLALSIILSWYPAKNLIGVITPNAASYFSSDLARFLWAIAPLMYLGIIKKRLY